MTEAKLPSSVRFVTEAGTYLELEYPLNIPISFRYLLPDRLPATPSQIQVLPNGEWQYVTSLETNNNWLVVENNTQLVKNINYAVNSFSLLDLVLPLNAEVNTGDCIIIHDQTGSGFVIKQGLGQQIRYGNKQTSLGIAGSIVSSEVGDTLELIYLVSNWIVGTGSIGIFDVC